MLKALAEHRAESPGAALPLGSLLDAGWPNERVGPEAGAKRVYTALWELRRLGLKELLQSRDDGYLLDPKIPIVLVAEDSI
jgi:hypothetical protein